MHSHKPIISVVWQKSGFTAVMLVFLDFPLALTSIKCQQCSSIVSCFNAFIHRKDQISIIECHGINYFKFYRRSERFIHICSKQNWSIPFPVVLRRWRSFNVSCPFLPFQIHVLYTRQSIVLRKQIKHQAVEALYGAWQLRFVQGVHGI